jgi:hypothetical protein
MKPSKVNYSLKYCKGYHEYLVGKNLKKSVFINLKALIKNAVSSVSE